MIQKKFQLKNDHGKKILFKVKKMVVRKKVSNTYRLALTVGKSEANNRSNKKVLFERKNRMWVHVRLLCVCVCVWVQVCEWEREGDFCVDEVLLSDFFSEE